MIGKKTGRHASTCYALISMFSGGTVNFNGAAFSGTRVNFGHTEFSGGKVDFTGAADWSHAPEFAWAGLPPAEVTLPTTATEAST